MKKQYIAPISEQVFPESLMEGFNPGCGDKGGGILQGTQIAPEHIICTPGRVGVFS